MRNPFGSEHEAFRTAVAVAAALAPAALAGTFGPSWLALALFALGVVALAAAALRRRGGAVPLRSAPAHHGPPDARRVLVVANDTLADEELRREVQRLAADATEVLVLVPAVASRWRLWTGGTDGRVADGRDRLADSLASLDVGGIVSDAPPLQAIEDALATFPADEIVVATRRARPWDGLEPWLATLARERFALPVAQFVVDPA